MFAKGIVKTYVSFFTLFAQLLIWDKIFNSLTLVKNGYPVFMLKKQKQAVKPAPIDDSSINQNY